MTCEESLRKAQSITQKYIDTHGSTLYNIHKLDLMIADALEEEAHQYDDLFNLVAEKGQKWQGKCFKLQAENEILRAALNRLCGGVAALIDMGDLNDDFIAADAVKQAKEALKGNKDG